MAGVQQITVPLALIVVCSAICASAYVIPHPCNPSSPCTNGGECHRLGKGSEFICHCPRGYVGRLCQNNVLSDTELVTLIDARLDAKLGKLATRLEAAFNAPTGNVTTPTPTTPTAATTTTRPVDLEGSSLVFYEALTNITWPGAITRCIERGGHLAVPRSSEEQSRVVAQINADQYRGPSVWLGATDAETEGVWKDVSGTRLSYLPWGRGEPSNDGRNEHCLQMFRPESGWNWNDERCDFVARAYLCRF